MGYECKKCSYMQADMTDIQPVLDQEMSMEYPPGSATPYTSNCIPGSGEITAGSCDDDVQCLTSTFHISVDYNGQSV